MTRSRITALTGLALLVTACGQSAPRHAVAPSGQVVTLLSGTARQVTLGSLSAQGLADAQRSFGADLLKAVCST